MSDHGHKPNPRSMILEQREVTRIVIKVALVSLLASWFVTGVIMLLVGDLTAGTMWVASLASTFAPLLVAVPFTRRSLKLTLELNRSRQAVERLSRTDDLTQAYNRRHFMEEAGRELVLAARHGYPVCLLLIDLDGFKQVNDSLGHLAGDKVLVTCASAIRSTLRGGDMVGRFGGDEFLVLAPHSDLSSGADLARRLREALAATELVLGGQAVVIKASIGVVSNQGRADNADQLLREADQALYRAKELGGDRVELAA